MVIIGEVTKINSNLIQITIGKIIIEFELENNNLSEGDYIAIHETK